MHKAVSPSRTYVMLCSKLQLDGYYLRRFTLPKDLPNTSEIASWYFLTELDGFSAVNGCITVEDYNNIKDVSEEELPSAEEIE